MELIDEVIRMQNENEFLLIFFILFYRYDVDTFLAHRFSSGETVSG